MVDGVRADQWSQAATIGPMPAPPRHQLGHVVACYLGQQFVFAEELDQQFESVLGANSTGMMLANLLPVAARHIVEPQRCARSFRLRHQLAGALALLSLNYFGFALVGFLGRAEKATTVDLEIVLPERGARVASDGHAGESLRVWLAMN